jgi:two-component system NtrC family sensor kinase
VTQVLDQAIAFCEPIIDRAHVVVTREYDENLPALPAVRGQLQQVFINLLTNACHAVPTEGGRVNVAVSCPRPTWVQVRIEDNGPGIAEDRRGDVFRPFVTTKPSGQGTGLGLSIVRNLVERHGGTVEVALSDLGGASFILTLPMKPTSERPPAASPLSE